MTGSFRIDTDARGLAVVTFDAPGSKVNLWSRAALDEFDALLDELAGRGDLTGIVFRSGKPDTFIAGADVEELAAIDSAEEARELSRRGQAVFQRVTDLSLPVVAAIHGACVGGGLEFALACSFRVASDADETRLGFPEVQFTVLVEGREALRTPGSGSLRDAAIAVLGNDAADQLLDVPVTVMDVFVRSKAVSGRTLRELADEPHTRGVYLRKIMRNMIEIPVLPETEILRGDILTIAGATRHVEAAVAVIGRADRPAESTDLAVVSAGILAGGLVGALSFGWGGIPISLSTSGGALLAGLILGYLRTVHPTFGNIPGPALWLMNTLGLNVFIAIVGINAGPGFIAGLQQVGLSLFLWGVVATVLPLIVAVLIGYHVFKFHPAILFGVCAGVRTTTAALGMVQEAARSKVPALGYGMPYAIGNTVLTIFGMVIVLLMTRGA